MTSFNLYEDLTEKDFHLFKKYIYDKVGIDLEDHKRDLLRNRLRKRLVALNIDNFLTYYEFLKRSQEELSFFISAVTTNITSFFREPKQWEFLRNNLKKYIELKSDKSLKIWSAGCATGEEPYSIALFMRELFGNDYKDYNISILATDISQRALNIAKTGEYPKSTLAGLDEDLLLKYFNKRQEGFTDIFTIKDDIQKSITFKPFNLVYDTYPPTGATGGGKFDIIFCRNVMIYFDSAVKKTLIEKFIGLVPKGGYILVGHSESLMAFTDTLEARLYGIYCKK